MDLHNNDIGFAIGKMIQEKGGDWKDVVAAARRVMEQGAGKKSGGTVELPNGVRVKNPTWLPKERLKKIRKLTSSMIATRSLETVN